MTNVEVNREGDFESKLFFIDKGNEIKSIIYTIYKDKVDNQGSIINGRIYFNQINGTFIEGYRIEKGKFTKKIIVTNKPKVQKASFFFFFQEDQDYDCWNTDTLGEFEGGQLDEVILTAPRIGGGGSSLSNLYSAISSYNAPTNHIPSNPSYAGGGGTTSIGGRIFVDIVDRNEDGTPSDEEDLEYRILNNLTEACAKSIFGQLENGIFKDDHLKPEVQIATNSIITLNFSELILKLFNDSGSTDLTIQNGSLTGENANTTGATITISDNYLANATELSIARTMIHESVHAYINALYSNVVQFNSFTFRQKVEKYAKDKGYTIGTNNFHHEFMGQYVDAMAYSLYEWDKEYGTGGNLGWEYYRAMAWGGLFQMDENGNIVSETDSFKELNPNPSDRQKIADIVLNENNNNNNAKGTKCD